MRFLFIALFLASTNVAISQHHGGAADKPSVHGMVIFGQSKIYASHLPLFHAPHNYQIILELELDQVDKQKFIADQQQHPEFSTYTFEPEKFILPKKIAELGSFKANLFRGHFERGGIKIADSIKIKIVSIIYFKKFEPTESKTNDAVFLLFGNQQEQYAVHQIINKPDFDQIILVNSDWLDSSNKYISVSLSDKNNPVGVSGNKVSVKIKNEQKELVLLKQIYLEFDDLRE